ncbi:MAG: heparinase II/III domain-containing protein, partial [Opitutales bacterium]
MKRPTAFRKWPSDLGLRMPCGQAACRSVEARRFEFIGLSHSFEGPVDWEGAGLGKLWDYNLHYFEWIWSLDVEAAKCFVGDWVERHPYCKGAVGWEPYPLSLRITNWIAYWGTAGRAALESDPNFKATLFGSLGEQCNWLSRRLEKHLLGNHYFENAVALLLAGNFFEASEVPEAAAWKARGRKILLEQLPEQILPDGMHFERSPMYHNRIIHALEWLVQLGCDDDALRLKDWLERANAAAALLKHPDGKISLFNDSAFGIYPENTTPSPVGSFALPDAGYYGARTGRGDYLIVDAGRIGPDYLPGHAHCDIGSFELSLQGRRFITDSGVKNYEIGELRHYCRSAKAHNTVTPAGMEQAEIWAAFRVGRRPEVDVVEWEKSENMLFRLRLRHDGFCRMQYSR